MTPSGAAAAARISMEASGENSATLTPDPCDLSIGYHVHQKQEIPKNQAATLSTQEGGWRTQTQLLG